MTTPRFSRLVAALPKSVPFVGPEALERELQRPFRVRVGANESAFGISPKARAAMVEAVPTVAHYGDPESYELRAELARIHGTTVENVLVGSGIDDLFALLTHTFMDPETVAVTSLGSYPTFNYFVSGYGGDLRAVPYRSGGEGKGESTDPQRLAEEARQTDARLVYIANPDNPTGTCHGREALAALVDQTPPSCLLVLDEAYLDFVPPEDVLPIDVDDRRIVRLRTFSKAHGMAGLRIGYAIAHRKTIAACNKVRIQFGVNRLAQIGALASLREPDFIRSVVSAVAHGRRDYEELGRELEIRTLPSWTNFVSFDFGEPERAKRVLEQLRGRDVFVRSGAPPNDRLVRVTVGTAPERASFAKVFRDVAGRCR